MPQIPAQARENRLHGSTKGASHIGGLPPRGSLYSAKDPVGSLKSIRKGGGGRAGQVGLGQRADWGRR